MSEEIEALVRRVVAEEMQRFPIILNIHEPLTPDQLRYIERVARESLSHKVVAISEPMVATRTATIKHGGKLGGIDNASISYNNHYIDIETDGAMATHGVTLDVTQALSLLAWLEQERETLERLAKEQAS